eukprot:gene10782-18778_t
MQALLQEMGRKRKEGEAGAETRTAAEMRKWKCEKEMRSKG